MITVFLQVLKLLTFAAIGFLLCRIGILDKGHSGILSKLLVWVFLPCNIYKTFAKNCTVQYITDHYTLVIVSACATACLAVIMYFVSRCLTKNAYRRRVLEYSLVVPNSGYMGYPMAQAIMGDVGLTNAMIFSLPLSLYIYTYGFCILTKRNMSIKKLLNPVIISMALGITAGLCSVPTPDFAYSILDSFSSCMAPVSMILAGIVISEFKIKSLLVDVSTHITALIKLVAVPLATGGILTLLSVPKEIIATAVLIFSMPCGLNTIVFAKAIDEDCLPGASIALISSTLSCITVPLILAVFGIYG